MNLQSYVCGRWQSGDGEGIAMRDATTGELIALATSSGIDFAAVLEFSREVGGPALRALTFHQRATMLRMLAKKLTELKEEFYALSYRTGATKNDALIDIDGGIGTVFAFAGKGSRELPNSHVYVDGDVEALSKGGTFVGQHLYVSREGAAVHINAFNFPVWGMLEKLAPTLLAGIPAIVKPATATAYLTELVVRRIIDSKILPEGALQLVCGSLGDLFQHLNCQDAVSFTGSAHTAERLRTHPAIVRHAVPFIAETDSLNSSILGLDASPGTPEFDLFIKEPARRSAGSLAGSVFTGDDALAAQIVLGLAPYHGRILVVNQACAKESTGHGSPLAPPIPGGPGRAGGGEEMGGIRGVLHYMQRTA